MTNDEVDDSQICDIDVQHGDSKRGVAPRNFRQPKTLTLSADDAWTHPRITGSRTGSWRDSLSQEKRAVGFAVR